ncbi:MAG: helix-turn-helix transcriptional regulator [Clostridia bacterium]|jgi:transcriptional regulator with XRE-family HTH domain|nr:helix-turn-helix domain-containing protein [Clostridia bacterium]MDD4275533.1 helix-turn-helix transcriptional regulator [Clostridia bacterium]
MNFSEDKDTKTKKKAIGNQLFTENLKNIMREKSLSQRKLAELTGISVASINNYINRVSDPSIVFLLKLKNAFNISIDSLLTEKLNSNAEQININILNSENKYLAPATSYRNYLGNYIVYYYDSAAYKGKSASTTKDALRYGVVSIYETQNKHIINEQFKVATTFVKIREEAENLKRELDKLESPTEEAILTIQSKYGAEYSGKIELTFSQTFILIESPLYNDKALIIFNNPPTTKKYVGGIGTVSSISRGREQMPCIQFIILSRYILSIADGEIYNMLALGEMDIDVRNETEQLLKLFKNLYITPVQNGETEVLEDYQKFKIMQNSVELMVENLIEANMFRFAKISNFDDDNYYRIIKSEATEL